MAHRLRHIFGTSSAHLQHIFSTSPGRALTASQNIGAQLHLYIKSASAFDNSAAAFSAAAFSAAAFSMKANLEVQTFSGNVFRNHISKIFGREIERIFSALDPLIPSIPYVLDPAYLFFWLIASCGHPKPLTQNHARIERSIDTMKCACGAEYEVFRFRAMCLYWEMRIHEFDRLEFDCSDFKFPQIACFGEHQLEVRMLSAEFHEFLLRKKIIFICFTPPYGKLLWEQQQSLTKIPDVVTAISGLEYCGRSTACRKLQLDKAKCVLEHYMANLEKLTNFDVSSGLCHILTCIIELVLVKRTFACKDPDFQNILIDWFCNDYDIFWTRGTYDLVARLVFQNDVRLSKVRPIDKSAFTLNFAAPSCRIDCLEMLIYVCYNIDDLPSLGTEIDRAAHVACTCRLQLSDRI